MFHYNETFIAAVDLYCSKEDNSISIKINNTISGQNLLK